MTTATANRPEFSLGLPQPYRLFLGDVGEPGFARTAFGLRDWAGEFAASPAALEDLK